MAENMSSSSSSSSSSPVPAVELARAREWLNGQKWKLERVDDRRAGGGGVIITRKLVEVPRELIRPLVEVCIAEASTSNPQIEGKTYWGEWKFTRHVWSREDRERGGDPDDNRLVFYQTMGSADAIAQGYANGSSCTERSTVEYYWDVPEILDCPAGSTGVTYRLGGVFRDGETGLYSYFIEKTEKLVATTGEWTSEESDGRETRSQVWLNVRQGDVDQDGNPVPLKSMAQENGVVKRESRNKNADCTTDIRQDFTTPREQAGGRVEARHDQTATTETASEAEFPAALPSGASETGRIVEVANRPTEAGNWDVEIRTTEAIDQAGAREEARHDQTAVETTHTHEPLSSLPSFDGSDTPAAGTVSEDVLRPTAFGDFERVRRTTTAHDQTGGAADLRHDQTATTETHTQASSEVSETSAAPGTIVEFRNAPTAFGLMQTVKTTTQAHDQTGGAADIRHDQTATTETHTQASSAVSDTSAAPGTIVEFRNAPTAFGLTQTVKTTTTAHDQQGGAADIRHDQTATTETHTQADAVTATSAESGTIVEYRNVPTAFGRMQTVKTTTTAKDQEGRAMDLRHDQTATTETHTQTSSAVSDSSVESGTIVEYRNVPTAFGLTQTVKTTTTAKDQQSAVSWETKDATGRHQWWRNQEPGYGSSAAASLSSLEGSVSVSTRLNEFGLEDGTLTLHDPKGDDATTSWWSDMSKQCRQRVWTTTFEYSGTGAATPVLWHRDLTWTEHLEVETSEANAVGAVPANAYDVGRPFRLSSKRWGITYRTNLTSTGWTRGA